MPKLTKQTAAIRVTQAIFALQLISRGVDKETACTEAGLSTNQYDRWVESGDDLIEALQLSIVEQERRRLADISTAQSRLYAKLLELADNEHDPEIVLRILNFLGKQQDKLEQRVGIHGTPDNAGDFLLEGPNIRVEKSKMIGPGEQRADDDVELTVRPGKDGSVTIGLPRPKQIIDYDELIGPPGPNSA